MLLLALSLWHCDLQQSVSASLWVSVNSLELFQDPTQRKAVGEEARRKNGTNLKMPFDLLAPRRKSQVDSLLKSSFRIDGVLPSPQNERDWNQNMRFSVSKQPILFLLLADYPGL